MDNERSLIKEYKKGEIILYKENICNFMYYVLSGCLKSYVIDKSGKEHILQFAPENWYVSDIESFFNNSPSKTFIEAIEDSKVKVIFKNDFMNINSITKEELINQNNKLIKNIISTNKRLASILADTGEERYLDFLKTYPSLAKKLPLRLIASYIGVTPEYLSDIRRKITKSR